MSSRFAQYSIVIGIFRLARLIAALKDRLAAKTAEYEAGYREILDWLNSLSDSQAYLILFSRLINFEDWGTIADNLGGRNCANTVRRRFTREIKKLSQNAQICSNLP
jgi:hypothetical protein